MINIHLKTNKQTNKQTKLFANRNKAMLVDLQFVQE